MLQFAISCSGYGNYHDDISATMQLFQDQHLKGVDSMPSSFIDPFLRDVHSVSQLNIDFSGDIRTEIYLKNSVHQRTLSMQQSLGYWGDAFQRSLSSKIAIAILQLRWAALACAMGLKPAPSGTTLSGEAELKRTGILITDTLFCCILNFVRNCPLFLRYYIMDAIINELCHRRTLHTCGCN